MHEAYILRDGPRGFDKENIASLDRNLTFICYGRLPRQLFRFH